MTYEGVEIESATIYTLVPLIDNPKVRKYTVTSVDELHKTYRRIKHPDHSEAVLDVVINDE